MFTDFFYVLKNHGLNISTTEWLMLMDALDKDLAHSNFTDFYYLCRTILVKSEGDYDKFDIAFQEYFNDIKDNSFDMSKIDAWLHNDVETGKKTETSVPSVKPRKFIVNLRNDLVNRKLSITVELTGLVWAVALNLVKEVT